MSHLIRVSQQNHLCLTIRDFPLNQRYLNCHEIQPNLKFHYCRGYPLIHSFHYCREIRHYQRFLTNLLIPSILKFLHSLLSRTYHEIQQIHLSRMCLRFQ
jgi:hypothetical protein